MCLNAVTQARYPCFVEHLTDSQSGSSENLKDIANHPLDPTL